MVVESTWSIHVQWVPRKPQTVSLLIEPLDCRDDHHVDDLIMQMDDTRDQVRLLYIRKGLLSRAPREDDERMAQPPISITIHAPSGAGCKVQQNSDPLTSRIQCGISYLIPQKATLSYGNSSENRNNLVWSAQKLHVAIPQWRITWQLQ